MQLESQVSRAERGQLFRAIAAELFSSAPWMQALGKTPVLAQQKRTGDVLASQTETPDEDKTRARVQRKDSRKSSDVRHQAGSFARKSGNLQDVFPDLIVHRNLLPGAGLVRMKSLGNFGPQTSSTSHKTLAIQTRKKPEISQRSPADLLESKMLQVQQTVARRNFRIRERARVLREKDFARHAEQLEKTKAISDLRRVVESFVRAKKDRTLVIDFKDRSTRRQGVSVVPVANLPQMAQMAQLRRRDPFATALAPARVSQPPDSPRKLPKREQEVNTEHTPPARPWNPQEAELEEFIVREIALFDKKKKPHSSS